MMKKKKRKMIEKKNVEIEDAGEVTTKQTTKSFVTSKLVIFQTNKS